MQAEKITREIGTLINAHLTARDTGQPSSLYTLDNRVALADLLVEATGPAAPEPDCMPTDAALITKDGTQLEPGITLTLYRVDLPAGTTTPVNGLVAHDGFLVTAAHPLAQTAHKINGLYASHIKAWDAHKSYKASHVMPAPYQPGPLIIGKGRTATTADGVELNHGDMVVLRDANGGYYRGPVDANLGGILTTDKGMAYAISTLYFRMPPASVAAARPHHTRDMAALKTDKIYALWYCDGLTGEILRVNGRVTRDGKLAELAGMDAASMDVSGLYFWRVNCLKDQLAAQSPDVAATEYTDNAEMDTGNDDDEGQD